MANYEITTKAGATYRLDLPDAMSETEVMDYFNNRYLPSLEQDVYSPSINEPSGDLSQFNRLVESPTNQPIPDQANFKLTAPNQEKTPEPAPTIGDTARGFEQSFTQLPELGYGVKAGAYALGEMVAGEGGMMTQGKKQAVESMIAASKENEALSRPSDSPTQAWEMAKQGDIGALADMVQYGIGYGAGQGLQAIVTGGLGSVTAKAATSIFAKEYTAKLVEQEIAKISEKSLAEGLTQDQIAKQATANVADNIATKGATVAMGAQATGMEGGEIMGDVAKQSVEQNRAITPWEAIRGVGATAAASYFEFLADKFNFDVVTGKKTSAFGEATEGLKGRLQRGIGLGAEGATREGLTEFAQTLIEEGGKGADPFSSDSFKQAVDSAILGGIGGGAISGSAGALSGAKPAATAQEAQGQTTAEPAQTSADWNKTMGDIRNIVGENQLDIKPTPPQENTPIVDSVLNKLQTIPYDTWVWNEGTRSFDKPSGESKIIDYGGRPMVVVDIDGVNVPFYQSTGMGGKKNVPTGKWYPFFGISEAGWINKTGGTDMTTYYGSSILRKVANQLDNELGNILGDTTIPKVGPSGKHFAFINTGFTPTENEHRNTLVDLRRNIANLLSRLHKNETPVAKTPPQENTPIVDNAVAADNIIKADTLDDAFKNFNDAGDAIVADHVITHEALTQEQINLATQRGVDQITGITEPLVEQPIKAKADKLPATQDSLDFISQSVAQGGVELKGSMLYLPTGEKYSLNKAQRDHYNNLVVETPVAETPVAETPVAETPVVETPVVETNQKITPEIAGNLKSGDIVIDANDKEYLAHSARQDYLEAFPIVNGKADVSKDTLVTFHLTDRNRDAYKERNNTPVFTTGKNLYSETPVAQTPTAQKPVAEKLVENKKPYELTREEYSKKFPNAKEGAYDSTIHSAMTLGEISQKDADKVLLRDSTGNKYIWAKTRNEIEEEKKNATRSLVKQKSNAKNAPTHTAKWAQQSEDKNRKAGIEQNKQYYDQVLAVHKERVQEALDEGKPVPKEVLADYPDLKNPVAQTPVAETPVAETGTIENPILKKNGSAFPSQQSAQTHIRTNPELSKDTHTVIKLDNIKYGADKYGIVTKNQVVSKATNPADNLNKIKGHEEIKVLIQKLGGLSRDEMKERGFTDYKSRTRLFNNGSRSRTFDDMATVLRYDHGFDAIKGANDLETVLWNSLNGKPYYGYEGIDNAMDKIAAEKADQDQQEQDELLNTYTNEELNQILDAKTQAEKDQLIQDIKAEKKRKADQEVDTVVDEMLGKGKTTTMDIFTPERKGNVAVGREITIDGEQLANSPLEISKIYPNHWFYGNKGAQEKFNETEIDFAKEYPKFETISLINTDSNIGGFYSHAEKAIYQTSKSDRTTVHELGHAIHHQLLNNRKLSKDERTTLKELLLGDANANHPYLSSDNELIAEFNLYSHLFPVKAGVYAKNLYDELVAGRKDVEVVLGSQQDKQLTSALKQAGVTIHEGYAEEEPAAKEYKYKPKKWTKEETSNLIKTRLDNFERHRSKINDLQKELGFSLISESDDYLLYYKYRGLSPHLDQYILITKHTAPPIGNMLVFNGVGEVINSKLNYYKTARNIYGKDKADEMLSEVDDNQVLETLNKEIEEGNILPEFFDLEHYIRSYTSSAVSSMNPLETAEGRIKQIENLLKGKIFQKSNIKFSKAKAQERLAPNGEPSNLNATQYEQVRTPEFKAWFGDWENDPENASKVVDENGEPLVVYHGSTYSGINEFLPHDNTGELSKELSDKYEQKILNNEPIGYMNFRSGSFFSPKATYAGNYTGEDNGVMYPVFIKAMNPLYMDMVDKDKKTVIDKAKTIDALILTDVGGISDINEIAILTSGQIKSATGNTGAFSKESSDIRFSKVAKKVLDDNPLAIVHNISLDNLAHADKMGGLPAPSIAVVNQKYPLSGFGEITLIGDTSQFAPEADKANRFYNADVYSPRYPRSSITYAVDSKAVSKANEALSEEAKELGKVIGYRGKINDSNIEDNGLTKGLADNVVLKYEFLKSIGKEPKMKYKVNKTPPANMKKFISSSTPSMELHNDPAFVKAVVDNRNAEIDKRNQTLNLNKPLIQLDSQQASNLAVDYRYAIEEFRNQKGKPKSIDEYETSKVIREKTNQSEYEKWLVKNYSHLITDERIFNGFTNSGKRIYLPHNLDTVVKLMTKTVKGGENVSYGIGTIRAHTAKQFKTVKAIQAARGEIVTAEKLEALKSELSDEFEKLSDKLSAYSQFSMVSTTDALSDLVSKGSRAFKEYYQDVPSDIMNEVYTFLDKLKNMPAHYFEGKIGRAVRLNEFVGALVPTGKEYDQAVEILKRNGIDKIKRYKKEDGEARSAALLNFSDVLFSKEQIATDNNHTEQSLKEGLTQSGDDAYGKGWTDRLFATGKFEIISDADAQVIIKEAAEISYSKNGDIEAFFNPNDGKTYFVAENIDKETDLHYLMMHEVGVHALNMGGDKAEFESILKQVDNLVKVKNPVAMKGRQDALDAGTPQEDLREETLAYLLKYAPKLKIVERFKAWFKNALRNMGKSFPAAQRLRFIQWANKLSDQDLLYIADATLRKAPEMLGVTKRDANSLIAKASKAGYKGKNLSEAQEWLNAVAKGLDMSFEARMERAREMGFDTKTKWYHGTNNQQMFEEFSPYGMRDDGGRTGGHKTISFTKNPEFASKYGNKGYVIPVFLNTKYTFDYRNEKMRKEAIDWYSDFLDENPEYSRNPEEGKRLFAQELERGNWGVMEHDLTNRDSGGSSFYDYTGYDSAYMKEGDSENIAMFDPTKIRSIFAAFDTDEIDSGNLLASKSKTSGSLKFSKKSKEGEILNRATGYANYENAKPIPEEVDNKDNYPEGVSLEEEHDWMMQQLRRFDSFRRLNDKSNELINKYLTTMGRLPELGKYLGMRYQTLGKIDNVDDIVRNVFETLRTASKEDSKEIYTYLTDNKATTEFIHDPKMALMAKDLKEAITIIGKKLVEFNIIPMESFQMYEGRYLPRVYLEHIIQSSDRYQSLGSGKTLSPMGYAKKRNNNLPEEFRRLIKGEVKNTAYLASRTLSIPLRDIAMMEFFNQISNNEKWVWKQSLINIELDAKTNRPTAIFDDDGVINYKATNTALEGKSEKIVLRKVTPYFLDKEADRILDQSYSVPEEDRKDMQDLAHMMKRAAAKAMVNMDAIPSDFIKIPNVAKYGSLRGLVVHKLIYDDLVGTINTYGAAGEQTALENFFGNNGILARITSAFKFTHVAVNIPTQVMNLLSNGLLLHLSGVRFDKVPVRVTQAFREVLNDGENYKKMVAMGGRKATFSNQELKGITDWLLENEAEFSDKNTDWFSIVHIMRELSYLAGKTVRSANNLHQNIEMIFKVAKFIDMKSKGANDETAAVMAHQALFDYSFIPRWAKWLRTVPMGIPFITWTIKSFESTLRTVANRPTAFLPYYMLGYAMSLAAAADFGDDGEDKLKAILKLLPERMQRGGNIWILPIKDDSGRTQFIDMKNLFPWGKTAEAVDSLSKLVGNQDVTEIRNLADSIGVFSSPITQAVVAIDTNKDAFTGKPIVDENDTSAAKLQSILEYTYGMMMPPMLGAKGDIATIYKSQFPSEYEGIMNKDGSPKKTETQAFIHLFSGISVKSVDVDFERQKRIDAFNNMITGIKAQRTRELRANPNLNDEERQNVRDKYDARIERVREKKQKFIDETDVLTK